MTQPECRGEARRQEYLALRQFLKLAEASDERSMAGRMGALIDQSMTPRQRQLVRLYYIDQVPMQEIADSLGLGVSSVSRTIKRGRVRLRRALDYGGRALAESLRG